MGTFGVKRASDEPFCPSTVLSDLIQEDLVKKINYLS